MEKMINNLTPMRIFVIFIILGFVFFLRSNEIPTGDEPTTLIGAYSIANGDGVNLNGNVQDLLNQKIGAGGQPHCYKTVDSCVMAHEVGVSLFLSLPLLFLKLLGLNIGESYSVKFFIDMARLIALGLSAYFVFYSTKSLHESAKSNLGYLTWVAFVLTYPFLIYATTMTADVYASIFLGFFVFKFNDKRGQESPLLFLLPSICLLFSTRVGLLAYMLSVLFLFFDLKKEIFYQVKSFVWLLLGGAVCLAINKYFYGSVLGVYFYGGNVGFDLLQNFYALVRYFIDRREGILFIYPATIIYFAYLLASHKKTFSNEFVYICAIILYFVILAAAPTAAGLYISGRYVLPVALLVAYRLSQSDDFYDIPMALLWGVMVGSSVYLTANIIISEYYGFTGRVWGDYSYFLPSLYCPGNVSGCAFSHGYLLIPVFISAIFLIRRSLIRKSTPVQCE